MNIALQDSRRLRSITDRARRVPTDIRPSSAAAFRRRHRPGIPFGGARFCALLLCFCVHPAPGQAILAPWGNLLGVRVQGALVEFESSTRIVLPDWSGYHTTVKYLQRPQYVRTNQQTLVTTELAGIEVRKAIEDSGQGRFKLKLRLTAHRPEPSAGGYFCLELPPNATAGGRLEWLGPGTTEVAMLNSTPAIPEIREDRFRGLRLVSRALMLEVEGTSPVEVRVRQDRSERPTRQNHPLALQPFQPVTTTQPPDGLQIYFRVLPDNPAPGESRELVLNFTVSPVRDDSPAILALDPNHPGSSFDGIGGNFRLQFPETDPAVIQYNLDHLRVTWGRVAMPWSEWDPAETADPLEAVRHRAVPARVVETAAITRTLAGRGMPVIVSAWAPPRWGRAEHQPPHLRGTALNPDKVQRLCRGIGAYLTWLKAAHGVEAAFFSLNEPEIGVEVRQTSEEHRDFLKMMGAELAERGLATRLLLGDTAHAIPSALAFLKPSLDDPGTHRHIGAIAFHTWRGCTETDLRQWRQAARSLRVPLLVTEAGPDAHLHEYPAVMLEPWFALQEIELYLRVCAVAQPAAIMHWQLTADYSVLWGGRVYGSEGPLRPTQRFWNLRQLGLTPPHLFAMPITSSNPELTCAAFGNPALGQFAIHVVNRGPDREAVLTGLPPNITSLQPMLTDDTRSMLELPTIPLDNGTARCRFPSATYTTLLGRSR